MNENIYQKIIANHVLYFFFSYMMIFEDVLLSRIKSILF